MQTAAHKVVALEGVELHGEIKGAESVCQLEVGLLDILHFSIAK